MAKKKKKKSRLLLQKLELFQDVIDFKKEPSFSKDIQDHIRRLLNRSVRILLIMPFIVGHSSFLKALFETIKTKNPEIKLIVSNYNNINSFKLIYKLFELSSKSNNFSFKVFDTNVTNKIFTSNTFLFERGNKEISAVFYRNTSQDNLYQKELIDLNVLLSFKKGSSLSQKIETYFFRVWNESSIIDENWLENYKNQNQIINKNYSIESINEDFKLGKLQIIWKQINDGNSVEIKKELKEKKTHEENNIKKNKNTSYVTNDQYSTSTNIILNTTEKTITLKESYWKIIFRIRKLLMNNMKNIVLESIRNNDVIYMVAVLCKYLNFCSFLFIAKNENTRKEVRKIFQEVYNKKIVLPKDVSFKKTQINSLKSFLIYYNTFVEIGLKEGLGIENFIGKDRILITKNDLLNKFKDKCKESRFDLIINEDFNVDENIASFFGEDSVILNLKKTHNPLKEDDEFNIYEKNDKVINKIFSKIDTKKTKENTINKNLSDIVIKNSIPINKNLILKNSKKNVWAKGLQTYDKEFIVLKGSIGTLSLTPSAKALGKWKNRFLELIQNETIKVKNKKLVFQKDYTFQSITYASNFLLGCEKISYSHCNEIWTIEGILEVTKEKAIQNYVGSEKYSIKKRNKIEFRLENWRKNVFAKGYLNSNNYFVVLKGSLGTLKATSSIKNNKIYREELNNLFNNKVITKKGDLFIFEKNYEFRKITWATNMLFGAIMSYKIACSNWKTREGKTFLEYYK